MQKLTPSAPGLVAEAPIAQLVDSLQSQLTSLETLAPSSDAVPTLRRVLDQLGSAIQEGRSVAVFLTVEHVARLSGRPVSTVRRICSQAGTRAGAMKVQGAWMINWTVFQQYLTKHSTEERA
jgi:hypothetical protein